MPLKLFPPRPGKTPNWTIRGSYLGIPVDRSARTHRKAIAKRELTKLERKIERGEFPEKAPEPVGKTFIAAAVAYMKAGGERESMARLIEHFGETPIEAIGQDEIDAAAIELLPLATPATRNRKVYTPLSAVLRSAGRNIGLKRPKGAKGRLVTTYLSEADAFAIIDAANAREPAFGLLLRFLLYTGVRIGEAIALRWEDVQLDQQLAYIGTTKNGDPRTTLLRADLCGDLKRFADGRAHGKVFPFHRGGGLKDRLTRAKLTACGLPTPRRHKKETKLERRIPPHRLSWVGFHSFRHTWATWMRRYGKLDVQGLQATGNWRDPRSAARYAHVAAREEWSKVETLPSRGKAVD